MLVFMLLASLSVSGTLSASADNKTGDGLAAYAMQAYNEGWKYVWGGASPGAVDCSGLIYSYVGGARVTEDQLYSSPESGYVSDGVPDIPGLGLWQPGHVGVYVGGGMAVDARDEISNVCYQSVSTKSWVMWFKVAGVTYGTDSSVTKDDQSEKTTDTSSDKGSKAPEQKPSEPAVLQLGSTGSQVKKLQERLKELGYFNDDTTEYFGYVTQGALIEFQSAAGLSVNGVYDEATKAELMASDAPKKAPAKTPDSDLDSEEEQKQSDSESLGSTQTKPAQPSSDTAPANDDSSTDSAADPVPEEVEADDTDTSVQLDTEEDSEQSSANGSDPSDVSTDVESDAVYEPGDVAAEISDIQYILIKLGYFDYNITGVYCENTADAVEHFRSDYDLGSARSINAESLSALYGVYNGTYAKEETYAQKPAAAQITSDDSDSAEETEAAEPQAETDADDTQPKEQSVTITLSSTDSDTISSDAAGSTGSSAPVADTTSSQAAPSDVGTGSASSQTSSAPSAPAVTSSAGSSDVVFVQTGAGDFFTKSMALIAIGISIIVIFFAGTIHYWNVSMEKRKQRARRATTVSVYHKSLL